MTQKLDISVYFLALLPGCLFDELPGGPIGLQLKKHRKM